MATSLDLDAVGTRSEPFRVSWTSESSILYALGVGAGQEDPAAELQLTTQNTDGIAQQMLPTHAVVLGQTGISRRVPFGSYEKGTLIHAEQTLVVHEPLRPSGEAELVARLDGIQDKASGALIAMSADASDPESGRPLWTSSLGYYIRGAGGFAGDRRPSTGWDEPEGEPDEVISVATRPDQALLYRLSGDLNPLHSDPTLARKVGFPRPILHGLCTYGVVARVLARSLCDGDQSQVRSMSARFSRPVYPGDTLSVSVWKGDSAANFKVTGPDGSAVLERGQFGYERDKES